MRGGSRLLFYEGFTGVGYPKVVPVALADHVEKNNLQVLNIQNLIYNRIYQLEFIIYYILSDI